MLRNEPFRFTAILLLISLTIIGNIVAIPVLLQVALHTVLIVYIGAVHSVKLYDANSKKEVEMMAQKDAWMFPVFGSGVLFGLFLLFKYFNKDYINILFHYYFSVIGAYCVGAMIYERLVTISVFEKMSHQEIITIPPIKFITEKESKIDLLDVVSIALGSILGLGYFFYKNWTFNNLLGIAFSLFGIENMMLGQFKVGFILLGLLFFYDIFWVFGTPVMVSVAKNLDGPIKLMFPKTLDYTSQSDFNMIGLGDIVLPGVFVALTLRFDLVRYFKNKKDSLKKLTSDAVPFSFKNCKTFIFTMAGYTAGIIVTLFIMVVFKAAQPALLYLVPGVFIGSMLPAYLNGYFKELWEFDEEKVMAEIKPKVETPAQEATATVTK
jgi:minor histocompatibility antigen H13